MYTISIVVDIPSYPKTTKNSIDIIFPQHLNLFTPLRDFIIEFIFEWNYYTLHWNIKCLTFNLQKTCKAEAAVVN